MSDQGTLERLFCDAFGAAECSAAQQQAIRDARFLAAYPLEVVIAGVLSGASVPVAEAVAVESDATETANDSPVESPVEDMLITESAIPPKWHDELEAAGLVLVSDVRAIEDLTTIAGIGPRGAKEILEAIA